MLVLMKSITKIIPIALTRATSLPISQKRSQYIDKSKIPHSIVLHTLYMTRKRKNVTTYHPTLMTSNDTHPTHA